MSGFNKFEMSSEILPWVYSRSCEKRMKSHNWPKISIITSSYNQREFLEAAIQSVLLQEYPNLEYIIIDGGSADDSQEIIRRYEAKLAYWVSEPDQGMYHAINKGFRHATGDIMAWLNSSDMLCPWALWVIAQVFVQNPKVKWITSLYPLRWERNGLPVRMREVPGYSRELFYEGSCNLQQESTFWRADLWQEVGGLDEQYRLAADVALWVSFYECTDLFGVNVPLGGSRYHFNQKNRDETYKEEYRKILRHMGGKRNNIKTQIRRTMRSLHLHHFPVIARIINRVVGYRLHTIEGKSLIWGDTTAPKDATNWRIRIRRELI